MDEQRQHYANKLTFEIDSWDLKFALEAGENIVVVDARSPEAYQKEHITGALNMKKLGFRVKELIGGLDWWERNSD